ncbi:MAG TPA: HAD family hydrolase [Candidatus Eubacterium faecipullorum]|uniref:HAD family hydrolase n=1 Tax=Candidatus Eubacterium faecipullorum TaxID=2838571 RepID=A0A9D1RFM0_9FIRM|nr:HAD family hydrolase [Candidatus Eubacterium faecipullorum]
MFKYILFDLDGTLTDAAPGITNSIKYALGKFKIQEPGEQRLRKCLGPPLITSFSEIFGLSEQNAEKAVEYYREYFKPRGIYENEVYAGIPELLNELKAQEKTLIVATSKPEPFAKTILEHFGLDGYFALIAGSNLDNTRSRKTQVIDYALETLGINDRENAVMVGDREHDIIGAKETGLRSIGVLYGYAAPGELESAGADFLANTPQDIYDIINSKRGISK